jgi:hypothetical protein
LEFKKKAPMILKAHVAWVGHPNMGRSDLTDPQTGVITNAFDDEGTPVRAPTLLRDSDGMRLTPLQMKGIRLRLVGKLTPSIGAMLQESGFYVVWSEESTQS